MLDECETVKIRQATKTGYIECPIGGVADMSYPDSDLRRGRVQGNGQIAPTLMASEGCGGVVKIESRYRIRRLTERECFRLMDFSDEDYEKAASVISGTQQYKVAGNSIVRSVLMAIFSQLNIQGITPWNEREVSK